MSSISIHDLLKVLLLSSPSRFSALETFLILEAIEASREEAEDDDDDDDEGQNQKRRRIHTPASNNEPMRQRKVPRLDTVEPHYSPWARVSHSDNVYGFMIFTGLDPPAFGELLKDFAPRFNSYTPYVGNDGRIRMLAQADTTNNPRGRPRKITASTCLGLVLFWTRSICPYKEMAQYFGLTDSPCELWLRFGKRILLDILSQREDAKIRMPSREKTLEYVSAISAKYPQLPNCAFVGDGLKIPICRPAAAGHYNIMQQQPHAVCHGLQCDHFITNFFLFAPDGKIVAAVVNMPGSMPDSELPEYGMPSTLGKIEAAHRDYGVVCVMDSAYAGNERSFIIKAFPRDSIDTIAKNREEALRLNAAFRVSLAADWGMRGLLGAMPRLRTRWHDERKDERLIGISLIVRLHNYRANNMGRDQIRAVIAGAAP